MICPETSWLSTTAPVPPAANWIRLADGVVTGVGGTGVGGIGVAGAGYGTVVGTDVTVTNAGVGGAEVNVASAAIPVVEVGTTACWVVTTVGAPPLAGNLQAVTIASNTSSIQVKNILLFIIISLEPGAKYQ
jgi:hypothetical protein